jgi:hypothetical protein
VTFKFPLLISALTLFIFTSCQYGSSNDDDISYSPGNERQIDNIEATRIEIFCQSIQRYRKVLKSTGINQDVDLTITANTCSDPDLNTTTVEAVYDMTVEGDLYYQASEDVCEEKIWTEKVAPLGQYCNQLATGKRSDRIQVDLSLYVFAASADSTYGTKVILREFSVDPDTKSTTFQRAHTMITQTNVKNSSYGKVVNYALEERCADNDNTRYCSQVEK